jgi:aldose 1-epimerase
LFQSDLVSLSAGGFALELVPELGGSIASLSWDAPDGHSVSLLRPAQASDLASRNPSRLACFPLVPFANRIEGSRFAFAGREYRLAPNRPPDPMAIHGYGFQAAWRVEGMDSRSIRLAHEHRPPHGPFCYWAEQTIRLGPTDARIELAVTHEGEEPMPYGIGLHPWLPRPPDTQLQFSAEHVFIPDETLLPRAPEAVGADTGFATSRAVSEVVPLDACFAGWSRRAVVLWPTTGYGVEISASGAFCAVHVFAPKDRAVLCIEPVSHVPNVHNRPEWQSFAPLHTLKQDHTLRGEMMIRPVVI